MVVRSAPSRERPLEIISQAFRDLTHRVDQGEKKVSAPLKQIRLAEREVMPPVQRVQEALHPWVAFVIMPLFALANAGVNFHGAQLSDAAVVPVVYGVVMALVFGKPIGVVLATFHLVRTGLCKLPEQVTWRGVILVGLLAGIGFTMSVFIAGLAYDDDRLLAAAKLTVLCASSTSAVVGLLWGLFNFRKPASR